MTVHLTDGDRRALRALTRGQVGPDQLAARLGVSESAARARVSRLRAHGLVDTSYADSFAFYRLTDDGVRENRRRA